MFDVTVKTLDGRNQLFSLEDNITVHAFKEKIESSLNIPLVQQRIIFQGKVIQDDKRLTEYGVEGKVVHLVVRPPPSANPRSTSTSASRDGESEGEVTGGTGATRRVLVNEGYLHDMVENILADIGEIGRQANVTTRADGHGLDIHVNIPHNSHRMSLARIRQQYIARVERQARALLAHLDDPLTNTLPPPDYEVLRQESPFRTASTEAGGGTASGQTASSGGSSVPHDEGATPTDPGSVPPSTGMQPLPIPALADMMGSVRELWRRAEPHIDRWQAMLREDNDQPERRREAQPFYETVNRLVHLISHMMHNVSDFIVEFEAPSPRHLLVLSEMPVQTIQARINIDTSHQLESGGVPMPTDMEVGSPAQLAPAAMLAGATGARRQMGHSPSAPSLPTTPTSPTPTPQQSMPPPSTPTPINTASDEFLAATPTGAAAADSARVRRSHSANSIARSASARRNNGGQGVSRSTIQGSDGTLYMTNSSAPRLYFEFRPDAISVNSVSAHVIAYGYDGERGANSTTSSGGGTIATVTPSVGGAGQNQTTPTVTSASTGPTTTSSVQTTGESEPEVGGMPREVLYQVLDTALRQSLRATGIGGAGAGEQDTGGASRQQAGHHQPGHPSSEVDPYLPCHSRHYMDQERREGVSNDPAAVRSAIVRNLGASGRRPDMSGSTATVGGIRMQGQPRRINLQQNGAGRTPIFMGFSGGPFTASGNTGVPNGATTGVPGAIGSHIASQVQNNMHSMLNSVISVLSGAPGGAGGVPLITASTVGGANSGLAAGIGALPNIMTALLGHARPEGSDGQNLSHMTLGEFLQNSGMNGAEENPSSLLADMSNLLLTEWRVEDMFSVILSQDRRPLDRLRSPLQRLITARETQLGSRDALLTSLIEECRQIEEEQLTQLNLPNVDAWASVSSLYRYQLTNLMELVCNSPTDTGFGGLLMASLNRMGEEWVIFMEILSGGNDALLQRIYMQTFAAWTSGFFSDQPGVQPNLAAGGTNNATWMIVYNWFASMLRSLSLQLSADQRRQLRDTVTPFVVSSDQARSSSSSTTTTQRPITVDVGGQTSQESGQDVTAAGEGGTIRQWPMDTGSGPESDVGGSEFATPPEEHQSPGSDESFAESESQLCNCVPGPADLPEDPLAPHPDCAYLLDHQDGGNQMDVDDGADDGSTTDEVWKAVLPKEWVRAVARDVASQQQNTEDGGRIDGIKPPSDGYVAGMPPKRRKLMLAHREAVVQAPDRLLSDCVCLAARQSGAVEVASVAPPGPIEPTLNSVFKEFVIEKVSERLESDEDYNADNFPSTELVFRKKKPLSHGKKIAPGSSKREPITD